jgi:hypothetical protein
MIFKPEKISVGKVTMGVLSKLISVDGQRGG